MKPLITGLLAAASIALLGFLFLRGGVAPTDDASPSGSNVAMVDGRQVVTITAKGGYAPTVSTVKAGVPTTIRFATKGTFDCSSIVSIPSLGINEALPPSGMTDIDVGELAAGTLQGTCGMGMYRFEVDVRE